MLNLKNGEILLGNWVMGMKEGPFYFIDYYGIEK